MVDQANGAGTDTSAVSGCSGEDYSGGAFRSMANPPAYGDPDSMTSALYDCDATARGQRRRALQLRRAQQGRLPDGRRRHASTASPSRASAPTKTAQVMLRAADRPAHARRATTPTSTTCCRRRAPTWSARHGITAGDCAQVTKAVQATEMNQPGSVRLVRRCRLPQRRVAPRSSTTTWRTPAAATG